MKPLLTLCLCALLLCGCETVPVPPTPQPQHKPITKRVPVVMPPIPVLPPIQSSPELPLFTFNFTGSLMLVQVPVVPAMIHLVWTNDYIMPTTETCVDGSTDLSIRMDNWPCVFHGRTNECYLPTDKLQAFFIVSDYTPSP